eukprot:3039532-Pyramimonas_sp.AAC.1
MQVPVAGFRAPRRKRRGSTCAVWNCLVLVGGRRRMPALEGAGRRQANPKYPIFKECLAPALRVALDRGLGHRCCTAFCGR